MSDLIKREDALRVAKECERQNGPLTKRGSTDYGKGLSAAGQAIASAIAALPAAAPAEDVRAGMDVLSSLSSYLGAGLGDETTTAEQYDKRIRWGIDDQISATVHRCADVIEELSKDAYSGRPVQWGQVKTAILALIPEAKP